MPKLTVDQIVKMKFSPAINGYNADEVDEFIDLLIEDIVEYIDEIEKLKARLKND
ncbi:DivIVA domain-containing protein [Mycoplasma sp. 128]|uniref:DivIVA domain-containing protein n=1 Tax=Mycoplasma sp. 3341 TaxID=3447506 RepID=UPI003F65768F